MLNTQWLGALLCLSSSLLMAQDVRSSELVPVFVRIPVTTVVSLNATTEMTAELFKPGRAEPHPVVVYSHGRSSTPQERADIREVIPRDYLKFWLDRGFAVVAPMRPGYGKTGGRDQEIPGHSWNANGACLGKPNYRRVMDAASPTVFATLDWVRKQAWADSSSILLTGNSVGGVLTVATGSQNLKGVIGFINFAGGIGGNPSLSPGKSCEPDQLRDLYMAFGKNAKVPNLWIYAENDKFWGSTEPQNWHAAYAQGSTATRFFMTSPLEGRDGHDLVFLGKDLWLAPVAAFVSQLGF